jgi:hypothetical protein
VALGQVFLRMLRFSLVAFIPSMLHTHLYLSTYYSYQETNGGSLGTLKIATLLRISGEH